MATLFTKIANGEIPSYKVAEDENFYAFLDINPLTEGHTLVIPKKEVDYIFDLDDNTYQDLFRFVKKVGKAVESYISCKRLGMVVYGLDVPHVHVHLIPLHGHGNEINFSKPKKEFTEEAFRQTANGIFRTFQRASS